MDSASAPFCAGPGESARCSRSRSTHVSPETLRKIESGRVATPAFPTIAAIAGALGLSLDAVSENCRADRHLGAARRSATGPQTAVLTPGAAAPQRSPAPLRHARSMSTRARPPLSPGEVRVTARATAFRMCHPVPVRGAVRMPGW
ncbi:hypothetical protein SALBM135S_09213 [Streptomyces alboniger]